MLRATKAQARLYYIPCTVTPHRLAVNLPYMTDFKLALVVTGRVSWTLDALRGRDLIVKET